MSNTDTTYQKIKDILLKKCTGNDPAYLSAATSILSLMEDEKRKAQIEVLKWVRANTSFANDRDEEEVDELIDSLQQQLTKAK